MKPAVFLVVAMLAFGAVAQERTVIEMSGGRVTDVEKVRVPPPDVFATFAQADADGNGCVDRQEAYDVGILNFKYFARRGCLDEAAYEAAGNAPNYGR